MFSKAPFLFVAVPGTAAVGAVAALLALGPLTARDDAFLARVPSASTVTTGTPAQPERFATVALADVFRFGSRGTTIQPRSAE